MLPRQMGAANTSFYLFLSFILCLHIVMQSQYCTATDNIIQSQNISINETLISSGQNFELGFFSLNDSSKQYVGIWYNNIPVRKYVWVANREKPLTVADSAPGLTVGDDGNLRLVDGNQNILWSTNISVPANSSVTAVLHDDGNLVLRNDSVSEEILWESFDHPCDTSLSGMKGLNPETEQSLNLSSWLTEDDPSPGKFVLGVSQEESQSRQVFIWKDSDPFWRSGLWNGSKYIGISYLLEASLHGGTGLVPQSDNGFYSSSNPSVTIMTLRPTGALMMLQWDEGLKKWNTNWNTSTNQCNIYGACGAFGVCNNSKSPICSCLKGFVPKSEREWSKGNWTSGCVRRTELLCDKKMGNSSSGGGKIDGFSKFSAMKLPDHSTNVPIDDAKQCKHWCLNDCSCLAYAYASGIIKCMIWTRNPLLDIEEFPFGEGEDFFLRLAHSELDLGDNREKLIISFTVISSVIFLGAMMYGLCKWKAKQRGKAGKGSEAFPLSGTYKNLRAVRQGILWRNHVKQDPSELPILDFNKIVAATNNFCSDNQLGEGGFGPVFKGKLEDGQDIAVKKLSRCSGQGIEEFKNEIILISKLQHRNLVRLFGCCIEGEELMIVYEYMPNRSLDFFLFDPTKRAELDWAQRFNIIQGIARGLLYLHRDSCLKIIHRDLKASNILLDEDMNPKISDFGLARTFLVTQELANTQRVVGTYGYMSPEYAMGGIFSEKSDVFSFGVLVLEIVSGMKNTSFRYQEQFLSLLGYAWQLWNEGRALEFMDQALTGSCFVSEVMRCIHIGLLCIQDHAIDRPTMAAIVLMLSSDTDAPQPKLPTFNFRSLLDSDIESQGSNMLSVNKVTITRIEGR